MITELRGDDRINVISSEIGAQIITVDYNGSIDLYQDDDWISLDKEQVKDLLKVLKKYGKL